MADHTLDANVRVALSEFLPGDVVRTVRGRSTSGRQGTIESIGAGHVASVLINASTEKLQLRDCEIVEPLGRRRTTKATTRTVKLGNWPGEYFVNARGSHRKPSGSAHVPVRGSEWELKLGESEPVPAGGRIVSVTIKAGVLKDQEWGGTGANGLRVNCLRHTDDSEYSLDSEEGIMSDAVTEVKYDHKKSERNSNRRVEETFKLPNDAFSPKSGDTFEVTLYSVQWGGWSSTCRDVTLEAEVEFLHEEELGTTLPPTWQTAEASTAALKCAWTALRGNVDSCLDLHEIHLNTHSESGAVARATAVLACLRQGCLPPDALSGSLLSSFDGLLQLVRDHKGELPSAAKCAKARSLLEKLASNACSMGAPADEEQRRKRYARLIEVVGATLQALRVADDKQRVEQLEVVVEQYGEAEEHCVFRWDREVHNMHTYVSGEASGVDAEEMEDVVLGMLQAWRRVLAGDLLHKVKLKEVSEGRADQAADTHFESAFYGRINFGLPETLYSRYDPNRLTYGRHGLTSMPSAEVLQAQLNSVYAPLAIISHLRKELIEPQTAAAQVRREKLIDWFKSHMPPGVASDEGSTAHEAWLFGYVHDEDTYELTDAALAYMLCVMGVLRMDAKVVLPGGGVHAVGRMLSRGASTTIVHIQGATEETVYGVSSVSRGLWAGAGRLVNSILNVGRGSVDAS